MVFGDADLGKIAAKLGIQPGRYRQDDGEGAAWPDRQNDAEWQARRARGGGCVGRRGGFLSGSLADTTTRPESTTFILFADDQAADDTRELQGTWQTVELEANGEKKSPEETQELKIVIKKDELWVVKPTGTDPKVKFKVDSQKSPKTIDLIAQEGEDKGKVSPGIYALEKGRLRLCINIFGDVSYRPAEFKPAGGRWRRLRDPCSREGRVSPGRPGSAGGTVTRVEELLSFLQRIFR